MDFDAAKRGGDSPPANNERGRAGNPRARKAGRRHGTGRSRRSRSPNKEEKPVATGDTSSDNANDGDDNDDDDTNEESQLIADDTEAEPAPAKTKGRFSMSSFKSRKNKNKGKEQDSGENNDNGADEEKDGDGGEDGDAGEDGDGGDGDGDGDVPGSRNGAAQYNKAQLQPHISGPMRKDPTEILDTRFKNYKDRIVTEKLPEVHILGEIVGGTGFGSGVSCKWSIEARSEFWTQLDGTPFGQSQVDYPQPGDMAVWNHPLDVHYSTHSIQGWPRLKLEVWRLDMFGRNELTGYGFIHIPSASGTFDLEVPTWRPTGNLQEEIAAYFLGGAPELTSDEVVYNKAWAQRCRLVTLPSGKVHVQISIVLRHFQDNKVDLYTTM